MRILVVLPERAGDIVTREELRERLWPSDTWVDFDHSLNTAVMKLRDALGDSADKPLYIETIPKRGYPLRRSGICGADGTDRAWGPGQGNGAPNYGLDPVSGDDPVLQLPGPIASPVVMLKQDARAGTSNLSSSRDGRTLLYAQSECKGSILMAEKLP